MLSMCSSCWTCRPPWSPTGMRWCRSSISPRRSWYCAGRTREREPAALVRARRGGCDRGRLALEPPPMTPQPGEQFAIAGRRDRLTVRACHLAATDEITGRTFYVVTADAGSRWSLVRVADGWLGTALPADPDAPAP